MNNLTPRDLRNAVIVAVVLTAVALLALLDPSCHPQNNSRPLDSHSLAPS